MNINDVTVEQKRVIIGGIRALQILPNIPFNKFEEIDPDIKDFFLIVGKLRFFTLDIDYSFELWEYDFEHNHDMVMDATDELINKFFHDYNCIEYINFIGFFAATLRLSSIVVKKTSELIFDNMAIENTDIEPIEQVEYLKILKKSKRLISKYHDEILLLFRDLIYLDFTKGEKIKTLLNIQKKNKIHDKNTTIYFRRFMDLFGHISKMSPAQLADFINSGSKNCMNYIVERDYNFCKQENFTVYKKDLNYLKGQYKNNLSRTSTGRIWRRTLHAFLLGRHGITWFGNYFQDMDYDVDELDSAYELINKSWLKKIKLIDE